jgi:hypothetical protein
METDRGVSMSGVCVFEPLSRRTPSTTTSLNGPVEESLAAAVVPQALATATHSIIRKQLFAGIV